jgi:hypothetical protein
MATTDLPIIREDSTIQMAYNQIIESDRSGCLVLYEDGALLYDADTLELQLSERGDLQMSEARGGRWIANAPTRVEDVFAGNPEPVLLGIDGQRAKIGFTFDFPAALPRKLYRCNLDQINHTYTGQQVKAFKKVTGGWECKSGDKGIVS